MGLQSKNKLLKALMSPAQSFNARVASNLMFAKALNRNLDLQRSSTLHLLKLPLAVLYVS